jgi:hypothetical protein
MNGFGGNNPYQHLNALTARRPMQGIGGRPQGNAPMTNAAPSMSGPVNVPSAKPPLGNSPGNFTGFNAPGSGPNTPGLGAGADPGGMLFFGLPQGTEELFGAAPSGFNKTLRPGNKMPGGIPGIF